MNPMTELAGISAEALQIRPMNEEYLEQVETI